MFILFDFDGVLVDSMPVWAGVHINMLKEFGVPVPEDFVKTITPLGNLKASEYTISLGADISLEDYLSRQHTVLSYEYGERIVLKDTVKETLETLKAQGHSLNVLTASPHRYVDPCLKRNGIYGLFDNVWTIDDFGLTKDNVKVLFHFLNEEVIHRKRSDFDLFSFCPGCHLHLLHNVGLLISGEDVGHITRVQKHVDVLNE